ncbi:MAG: xanthine dehydrogenase family protein subunit M [Deltaproteobacteria bacterium]|nr:xanthine dehydrogenase family protein subunit M [Deltaproteobacteria bacterium]
MKPAPFEYHAPITVEEAVSVLQSYGDAAKVLAGGQSLMPLLNFRLARPAAIVDINGIEGLDYLRRDGGWLAIGALARQRAAELSSLVAENCPLLAEALPLVGHFQIRNRGTILGSLAHADPAAELGAVALALGAELTIQGPNGSRLVRADQFFVSYLTTALAPDELLVEARFPMAQPRTGYAFVEFARRHGDFALVGVAAVVSRNNGANRCSDVRLAFTGVGPVPVLITDPEGVLRGQPLEPAGMNAFAERAAASLKPDSDIQASGEYRRELACVLAGQALEAAAARSRGD